MSITLGSLDTGSALHGAIRPSVWNQSRSVQQFFGLQGEYYLLGEKHGRDLSTWCIPSGYASHEALHDAIETINDLIGVNGTMTWTSGSDIKTFANTIFDGFETEEEPWLDGSGVNGWQVRGILKFRQVKS